MRGFRCYDITEEIAFEFRQFQNHKWPLKKFTGCMYASTLLKKLKQARLEIDRKVQSRRALATPWVQPTKVSLNFPLLITLRPPVCLDVLGEQRERFKKKERERENCAIKGALCTPLALRHPSRREIQMATTSRARPRREPPTMENERGGTSLPPKFPSQPSPKCLRTSKERGWQDERERKGERGRRARRRDWRRWLFRVAR